MLWLCIIIAAFALFIVAVYLGWLGEPEKGGQNERHHQPAVRPLPPPPMRRR